MRLQIIGLIRYFSNTKELAKEKYAYVVNDLSLQKSSSLCSWKITFTWAKLGTKKWEGRLCGDGKGCEEGGKQEVGEEKGK